MINHSPRFISIVKFSKLNKIPLVGLKPSHRDFISIFRTFFTLCDLLVFTLSTYDFFSILVALFFNEFLYCFGRSFNTSIIMSSPNFGSLTFYSWEIFYAVFNYSFFTTSFGTSFYIFVANLFLMIVPRLALLDLNNI